MQALREAPLTKTQLLYNQSLYHNNSFVVISCDYLKEDDIDIYYTRNLSTIYEGFEVTDTTTVDSYEYQVYKRFTITNTTEKELTITEIALYGYFIDETGAGVNVLLDLTRLPNPLKIPVGGVGQIEYDLSVDKD